MVVTRGNSEKSEGSNKESNLWPSIISSDALPLNTVRRWAFLKVIGETRGRGILPDVDSGKLGKTRVLRAEVEPYNLPIAGRDFFPLKYKDSWELCFLDGDSGKLGKTRVHRTEVEPGLQPSHYYWVQMRCHWAIGVFWKMCFSCVDSGKLGKSPRSSGRSRTYRLQIWYPTSWYGSNFHREEKR